MAMFILIYILSILSFAQVAAPFYQLQAEVMDMPVKILGFVLEAAVNRGNYDEPIMVLV